MDLTDEQNQTQNIVEESVTEKMLPQSEVNKIVGRAKAEAEQRVKRQLEEQYQRELENISQNQRKNVESGLQQQDADALYQQVQERFNNEMRQKQLENEMSQVANNYLSKVELARKNYEDFDSVTNRFDPTQFPQLVYLVAGMENGGDIVYELAKNPQKLVAMNTLAQQAPQFAQDELLKLGTSIKNNQAALQEAQTQEINSPLDRLKPSRTTGSNGKPNVRDLRNQDWLRG